MAEKYDAVIIGTGQSGPSLAVRLASARAAHIARRGPDFGVMTEGPMP